MPYIVSRSDELIVTLPYLIGFRPENSVVVVPTSSRETGRSGESVGPMARFDLDWLEPDRIPVIADSIARTRVGHAPSSLVIVVVGGGSDSDELPRRDEIGALSRALADRGVPVADILYAASIAEGAAWRGYHDSARAGVLPDPKTTAIAAHVASLGLITYDSREDLRARLDPAPDDERRRLTRLVSEQTTRFMADIGQNPPAAIRSALDLVDDAITGALRGIVPSTDEHRAALIAAVGVPAIRDACMAPRPMEDALRVEDLWISLFRRVDGPLGDDLLTLIAASAYLRGDGTFASITLEKTRADHRLAGVLRQLIELGARPAELGEELHDAAAHTRAYLRVLCAVTTNSTVSRPLADPADSPDPRLQPGCPPAVPESADTSATRGQDKPK